MERNPIIPENVNKRKFLILQELNLTFLDLVVWALFLGAGIVICVFLFQFSIGFKVLGIFIVFIFLVLGFGLNTKNSKHNKKNYAVIFEGFIFLFVNKKYKLDSKNDTKNLIPYEKIEGEYILLKNKKYLSFLKIEGNAFFDYEKIKRDDILEKIWEIYNNLEGNVGTIIKIDEEKSWNKVLFFLEEKRHEWEKKRKNNEINDKQYFSRIRSIEIETERYSSSQYNDGKGLSRIEKSIYLAIYSTSIEEMKNFENEAVVKFRRANLTATPISVVKKINVINKVLEVYEEEDIENHIYKFKDNLAEYFAFNSLQNKAGYLKVDEEWKLTINSVEGYKSNPQCGWFGRIFDISSPVIINFNKVNEKVFQETLAKARRNAISTANATGKKEILIQRKREQEVQKIEEFADTIGYGYDELYKFNIYVVNKGRDYKELRESVKEAKAVLKDAKLSLFQNPFKQIEAFSGMLPKPHDPLMDVNGREVPLYTLVWGMPYIDTSLNDDEGWYIGTSTMGDELILNPHIRNNERRNANMFFNATSGAGKSTTMQRMLKNEILNGNKIYIIDPENEYSKFADYFGESKIFLGDGLYKINPLQIMPSLADFQNDDEIQKIEEDKQFWNVDKDHLLNLNEDQNESLILNHQSVLEILFTTFFKDINEEDIRYLKNKFWFFYNYWLNQAYNKNILEWKNNEFPILQDFYQWLFENPEDNDLYYKLIELLEDGFVTSLNKNKKGTYSMFYNGYTSIDLTNNYLTIFDMSSLKDGSDSKLLIMQMFLTIKLIERQIKVNYNINPTIPQRLVVDEAHLLIDKDFPIALNFIYRMVKMIRKRNGGITTITQNPEDFVSEPEMEKKTKAIINNSQYAFIMKATENNLNKIEQLYSDSDGFTDNEKRDLVNANPGFGLLITSKARRFSLNMDVQNEDLKIIAGNERDLKIWTLDYLTTRIYNLINGLKNIDINKKNCVYFENNEERKLIIKLKQKHNLNINLFKNNLEIKEVDLSDNYLTINFKEAHKEITTKFLEKIEKKLRTRKVEQNNEEQIRH